MLLEAAPESDAAPADPGVLTEARRTIRHDLRSLAGYIVERVAGMPFDDYIEQKLLHPVGMKQSSFRQPLPASLKDQMSVGYFSQDKAGQGFEIISLPPAGSLSATGEDMGRFMLTVLNQGRIGNGDAQMVAAR